MRCIQLILQSNTIEDYLKKTTIINYDNKDIQVLADKISKGANSETELINAVYVYVRDTISHSADIEGKVVTCKASEVLQYKEGVCYAKSHLLAALLRYLKIPTGFCYQKLILEDTVKPWLILHGLNVVYLREYNKWIRLDARGNKVGVQAEFKIDTEKLAFPIREEYGEVDIPMIYTNPDPNVIQALEKYTTVNELFDNLPVTLYNTF